jgi:xylulokinase
VLVCDERGRVVGTSSSPHEIMQPRPGWSEQDPDDWWDATVHSIRNVLTSTKVRGDSISAIGLSGQMHGSVLLSQETLHAGGVKAQAIRPALLWNDQRTAEQCAKIELAVGGRAELVRKVGNAALTGFTAPKILWVRENEPENYKKIAGICLPKDFIGFKLTGVFATDVGDASGTLLFDVAARRWHREVCEMNLGIDPTILPPAYESAQVVGNVTTWAADQTGLREGTPVVAGSGDNMTSAVGSGVVERGIVAGALGTSGVIVAHSDAAVMDVGRGHAGHAAHPPTLSRREGEREETGRTHTMCSAAGPRSWCITGCMLSAGGSLKWVRDTLFTGVAYEELMYEASKAPAGSGGLVFLPYLTGERCPHPDPSARGGWIGLTSRHTRGHLVRSVVEGVSFGMGEILDIVRGMGIEAKGVRISGGGAKSPMWRQLLADVFGVPVVMTNSEEGPSHGAALLAGVGAGVWGSVPEACRAAVVETSVTTPAENGADKYVASRRVYGELYGDLKGRFGELGAVDR